MTYPTRRQPLAAGVATLAASCVFAQPGWRTKPPTVVAAFPPGGGTEGFARPLFFALGRLDDASAGKGNSDHLAGEMFKHSGAADEPGHRNPRPAGRRLLPLRGRRNETLGRRGENLRGQSGLTIEP